MNIDQFYHICRASVAIANVDYIFVYGSNAILPWLEDQQTSIDTIIGKEMLSIELDISVRDDDNDKLNTIVDATIGELSLFHDTHSVYPHPNTPTKLFMAPMSWSNRMKIDDQETYKIIVPHYSDLIFSKMMAGREKDLVFCVKMSKFFKLSFDTLNILKNEYIKENSKQKEVTNLNFNKFQSRLRTF